MSIVQCPRGVSLWMPFEHAAAYSGHASCSCADKWQAQVDQTMATSQQPKVKNILEQTCWGTTRPPPPPPPHIPKLWGWMETVAYGSWVLRQLEQN